LFHLFFSTGTAAPMQTMKAYMGVEVYLHLVLHCHYLETSGHLHTSGGKVPQYPLFTLHSFIPLACAECDNFLPFLGASSIPLFYILFPVILLHQLFFHHLSLHLTIYFLVYLTILLFPNSYIPFFWEFYFLPFSAHAQTNIIYVKLLSTL
jgi:hypothetical protein